MYQKLCPQIFSIKKKKEDWKIIHISFAGPQDQTLQIHYQQRNAILDLRRKKKSRNEDYDLWGFWNIARLKCALFWSSTFSRDKIISITLTKRKNLLRNHKLIKIENISSPLNRIQKANAGYDLPLFIGKGITLLYGKGITTL